MREEFEKNGFVTLPFPDQLGTAMLAHIHATIRELACRQESVHVTGAGVLEEVIKTIPDEIWHQKMHRCFRIFPDPLAKRALEWAHNSFCGPFGKTHSAVNVVFPQEVQDNPKITEDHLAVYWRCVRPGKRDAGMPHRDASFWDLEFKEGYDPKVPFAFNYLQNCMKIWIPLSGCYPDTTLRVIPCSHRMDIPTTVEQTDYGRRPSICPDWVKEHQNLFISPPELSQGSCILFDMNLVHVGPCHNQCGARISAEFNFITK
jgi:Phytanoyl-CoA dioxygenase (PhyH)